MPRRTLGVFAAVLIVPVGDGAMAQKLDDQSIGTVVRGSAVLGDRAIPLPEGDWTLVAKQAAQSSGGEAIPLVAIYLAQLHDGRLHRWIFAETNLAQGRISGWTRRRDICDRTDVHFAQSDSNYNAQDTECWTVNHFGMTLGSRAETIHHEFYRWSDDKDRPNTALTLNYFLVKRLNFLSVQYGYNPETEGFPPTQNAVWRGNPWHRDLVGKDLAKQAYVSRLRTEGEALLPAIRRGLTGR